MRRFLRRGLMMWPGLTMASAFACAVLNHGGAL
jgi:hypothetical protein